MKITLISGSHRHESESARVGRYLEKELKQLGAETSFLSLADNPLPLWDEGVWDGAERWETIWEPISKELRSSSGIVVISPEWSGMVPAGLKNFFLLCGSAGGDISHRAGLIVAVSSGIGGAYPVAELRMSSYKNTRLCYIPEHIIVRNVKEMLQDGPPSGPHDQSLRERITYTLKLFLEYSRALETVRASGVVDAKKFPSGA